MAASLDGWEEMGKQEKQRTRRDQDSGGQAVKRDALLHPEPCDQQADEATCFAQRADDGDGRVTQRATRRSATAAPARSRRASRARIFSTAPACVGAG